MRDTSAQDIVHSKEGKSALKLKTLIFAGAALIAVIFLGNTLSRWLDADASVSADRLRMGTVLRGDLLRDINVQGRIVAAVSPTLYSTASGTVTLEVQPGDAVTLGQILATMVSPEVRSEFEQESSALEGFQAEFERQKIQARKEQVGSQQRIDLAQVRLTAAQREMRRADKSIEISAISEIEYERYRDDLATAEVEHAHAQQDAELEKDSLEFEVRTQQLAVERQQLMVNNLQRRVDELTIKSPVDGIIGNVAIDQKAVVAANQPLVTVVDLTAFEVEARIPEAYADDMGIGMKAEVQYNGNLFAGELVSLSPEVINNEVVSRIRFSSQTPPGLRQNQRVTSRIVMDHLIDVLKIQRGSFADTSGGRIAFVVGDDGFARKQPIVLGGRSVSEVEIISGLREGQQIVISSIADFVENDVIQIVR